MTQNIFVLFVNVFVVIFLHARRGSGWDVLRAAAPKARIGGGELDAV